MNELHLFAGAGGLQMWDEDSDGEGNPGWVDYYDEETGDDFDTWRGEHMPERFMEIKKASGLKDA